MGIIIDGIMAEFKSNTESLQYPVPDLFLDGRFWHSLSIENEKSLQAVHQWVAEFQIDLAMLGAHTLHSNLVILRYLRANDMKVEKAIDHMKRNIAWRKERNVHEVVKKNPTDILGCEIEALTEVFPHWHQGYDKLHRPVLFKQYGKFDAAKVKKLTGNSFDKVIEYHIWEQEACAQLCYTRSLEVGHLVETVTVVIDIQKMTMWQITRLV